MIHCIAVDDEPLALELLQHNISKVPYLKSVAACSDAFEAIAALQENKIDLIFIDIQMPGLTGLQLVGSLKNKPLVIFITAYKEHAVESYDLDVVDYLVKPVSMERFLRACNRARELMELKNTKNKDTPAVLAEYIFVNVDYSQVKVRYDDISWIEGLRDYIRINLISSKRPLVVRSSLKAIEPELPPQHFLRIHKSFIVSVAAITSVRKNSVFIQAMELPVGETYRDQVEKLIRKKI